MSRFNLIDDPWIPVRWLNGRRDEQPEELGIRDTLLRAKDIAVIEDPSPLIVAALYRFLLAVLYRALEGPTDIDQAKGWFKVGLPSDKIDAYLEKWRDRFWLFHEEFPFFQAPDFEPKKWNAWTVLAAEHNTNQAKVLFDHVDVAQAGDIPAKAAARWLLAAQTFAFTGNSELGYGSFSPSANAAMVIPLGNNLADSLMLSLVDQKREVIKTDKPVWEIEPDSTDRIKRGIARAILGNAQLYTWPSRSIRLLGSQDGISRIAYAAGVKVLGVKDDDVAAFTDPMLAYRIDEEKGHLPIRFSDRGLWREFHSLLPGGDIKKQLAPLVIQHAIELTRRMKERFPKSFMVLGLSNIPGQAKINYWRMENFSLPETLISEHRSAYREIKELLEKAELAHAAINAACESFAKSMLSHNDRKIETKDVKHFVRQMPVSTAYWSTLEVAFHKVLRDYTTESDPDAIRLFWLKTVRAALRSAWRPHAASVSTSNAWAIRALVRAEAHINKQVGALNKEIQQYETYGQSQEETA